MAKIIFSVKHLNIFCKLKFKKEIKINDWDFCEFDIFLKSLKCVLFSVFVLAFLSIDCIDCFTIRGLNTTNTQPFTKFTAHGKIYLKDSRLPDHVLLKNALIFQKSLENINWNNIHIVNNFKISNGVLDTYPKNTCLWHPCLLINKINSVIFGVQFSHDNYMNMFNVVNKSLDLIGEKRPQYVSPFVYAHLESGNVHQYLNLNPNHFLNQNFLDFKKDEIITDASKFFENLDEYQKFLNNISNRKNIKDNLDYYKN